MKYINLESLYERLEIIRKDFQSKKPFRYTSFDNFFNPEGAKVIYSNYPNIVEGLWDGTTYINQKNKFQKNAFDDDSIFNEVFNELNADDFLVWLGQITGIKDLRGDEELFGGGLHQSIAGAFLNVHVDYNIHPKTKMHRRLNVLVYMNEHWKEDYEGQLELWDFNENKKQLLAKFAPEFNQCVIFETNEISFHGHPRPLKTPRGVSRKSIATYYYTLDRSTDEIAPSHNTIYVNTEGVAGHIKRLTSATKALWERIRIKK